MSPEINDVVSECPTCKGLGWVNTRETAPRTFEADACPTCGGRGTR